MKGTHIISWLGQQVAKSKWYWKRAGCSNGWG